MCHKENKDAGNREKNRSNAASNVLDKACRNMCKVRIRAAGIREKRMQEFVQKTAQGLLQNTRNIGCCGIHTKNGTRDAANTCKKMEQGLL
jgi:hypothetical protein